MEGERRREAGISKRSDATLIIYACLSLSLELVLSPILSKVKEKISLMIKNQPEKGIQALPGRLPALHRLYSIHKGAIAYLPLVGSVPCSLKSSPQTEQGAK